jgi:hypothetical protein
MKLNSKQLKKIDLYLEEIGVEYLDIRLEMLDHLASEIEENTKDLTIFFEYKGLETPFIHFMYSHKDDLINTYKKLNRSRIFSDIKYIVKQAIQNIFTRYGLYALIISILHLIFFNYTSSYNKAIYIIGFNALVLSIILYTKVKESFFITKAYGYVQLVLFWLLLIMVYKIYSTSDNTIYLYSCFMLLFFQLLIAFTYRKILLKLEIQYQKLV